MVSMIHTDWTFIFTKLDADICYQQSRSQELGIRSIHIVSTDVGYCQKPSDAKSQYILQTLTAESTT